MRVLLVEEGKKATESGTLAFALGLEAPVIVLWACGLQLELIVEQS